MSLESIRRSNIERNKRLLESLDLDSLSTSIANETKAKSKSKPQRSKRIDKPAPVRRSRRLAKGTDDTDEEAKAEAIERDRLDKEREELNAQRSSKLSGDFHLAELRADPQSGLLFAEKDIYGSKFPDSALINDQSQFKNSRVFLPEYITMETENVKSSLTDTEAPSSMQSRKDLSGLRVDSKVGFPQLRLTPRRISSLLFHPAVSNRLALAGDINGCLGIWGVDNTVEKNPSVILLRPHGRGITKIIDIPHNYNQVITGSYDGSCRILDLSTERVSEAVSLIDDARYAVGITDVISPSPNILYLTTSSGSLLMHDMRQKVKEVDYKSLYELHDKKIGGFCVNPSCENQIATASLDRSMKLWDVRNGLKIKPQANSKTKWAPSNYAEFNSRLSISSVDWNANNQLVCNGYDDRVRLFDLTHTAGNYARQNAQNSRTPIIEKDLEPLKEIKHNCQTGRWISILKARWQRSPSDGVQKFAIGNMNRSIDIYGETGNKIANLSAPEIMTAVPAVIALHPTENWILGGTCSGKIFLFS